MKGENGFPNRTADAWTSHSSRSCQPLALVLSDAPSADAIYQNQEFIFHYHANQVLILAGGEVGCMDLGALAAQHRKTKADLTVAAVAIEGKAAGRHYTLIADCEGWARTLVPPGSDRPGPLAVMGVLLFSTDVLSWRLSEDAQQPNSTHDLLHDVIPRMIQAGDRVMISSHVGYWNSLQTAHDYWQAQMDLLSESPGLSLQNAAWPIRGRFEVRPPTLITTGAKGSHSLLSDGCVVGGTVECSVLSPGVHVAPGAVVRNAVVMHNTTIEERARVENAILDMDVIVGSRAQVGEVHHQPLTMSTSAPSQLTVVEQGTHIPACEVVRPDCPSSDWDLCTRHEDVSQVQVNIAQMS